jgi:uncharacterized protein involved in exopolysaccharide biosynthesis
MLAFAATVMVAVVVATALAEPRYKSQSKLFLRLGRENVALDATATMGQGGTVVAPASREDEINSVVELLRSRALIERLIDDFGAGVILGREEYRQDTGRGDTGRPPSAEELARARADWTTAKGEPAPVQAAGGVSLGARAELDFGRWREWSWIFRPTSARERAIEHVGRRLSVTAPRRSTVISVEYEAASPQLAQALVQRLVDLYVEEHVRLNRPQGSHDFFVAQTGEVRARLETAERRLRDVKDATGLASAPDQRRLVVERIGALEDELLRVESALAVARAEERSSSDRIGAVPPMLESERAMGMSSEAFDGMRQQLYSLQLREQELLSKYTEELPAVQEVRRQIEEARAILAREESRRTEVRSGRNPAHDQLALGLLKAQTDIAALAARRAALETQLESARAALLALNDHEMQIAQAQRELDLAEANYRRYAESLEQARVDQALELQRISNISIVQPATLEERPVRPRRGINLGVGFLVAVCGALGLALLTEQVDRPAR